MFLPFDQRWTLGKSTLNEPVATADAVGPSVVDVDHVDLRVAAEPGIYTYTAAARICSESVNIDITICMYTLILQCPLFQVHLTSCREYT